jgi:hypothetical protein
MKKESQPTRDPRLPALMSWPLLKTVADPAMHPGKHEAERKRGLLVRCSCPKNHVPVSPRRMQGPGGFSLPYYVFSGVQGSRAGICVTWTDSELRVA